MEAVRVEEKNHIIAAIRAVMKPSEYTCLLGLANIKIVIVLYYPKVETSLDHPDFVT